MPRTGAFSMAIRCNGRRLPEHEVNVEGTTTTCWVESRVGQTFEIGLKNDRNSVDVNVNIYVDGIRVKSKLVPRGKRVLCEGMRVDSATIKPFLFTPLELSDDDNLLHTLSSQATENLGSIVLTVHEVEIELETAHRPPQRHVADVTSRIVSKPVHEKTKKLGGHRVGLSNNIMRKPYVRGPRIRPRDPFNTGPIATFVFKYRSLDILEAIGIVTPHKRATHAPRADSPSTRGTRSRKVKKEPTDVGGRSDEDVQRLELQHAEIGRRLEEAKNRKRIKREQRDRKDGLKEHASTVSTQASFTEVVDLTQD